MRAVFVILVLALAGTAPAPAATETRLIVADWPRLVEAWRLRFPAARWEDLARMPGILRLVPENLPAIDADLAVTGIAAIHGRLTPFFDLRLECQPDHYDQLFSFLVGQAEEISDGWAQIGPWHCRRLPGTTLHLTRAPSAPPPPIPAADGAALRMVLGDTLFGQRPVHLDVDLDQNGDRLAGLAPSGLPLQPIDATLLARFDASTLGILTIGLDAAVIRSGDHPLATSWPACLDGTLLVALTRHDDGPALNLALSDRPGMEAWLTETLQVKNLNGADRELVTIGARGLRPAFLVRRHHGFWYFSTSRSGMSQLTSGGDGLDLPMVPAAELADTLLWARIDCPRTLEVVRHAITLYEHAHGFSIEERTISLEFFKALIRAQPVLGQTSLTARRSDDGDRIVGDNLIAVALIARNAWLHLHDLLRLRNQGRSRQFIEGLVRDLRQGAADNRWPTSRAVKTVHGCRGGDDDDDHAGPGWVYVRPFDLRVAPELPLVVENPDRNRHAGSWVGFVDGTVRFCPGEKVWHQARALAARLEDRGAVLDDWAPVVWQLRWVRRHDELEHEAHIPHWLEMHQFPGPHPFDRL